MQQWQRGGRDGGGGSTAVAASLMAEVAAWRKCNFSGNSSAIGSAAVGWWRQGQQRGIGVGNVAYADNNFNGRDDEDD